MKVVQNGLTSLILTHPADNRIPGERLGLDVVAPRMRRGAEIGTRACGCRQVPSLASQSRLTSSGGGVARMQNALFAGTQARPVAVLR